MISRETLDQPLGKRLSSGLASGVSLAVVFSLIAIVSSVVNPSVYAEWGVSPRTVVGAYMLFGPAIGVALGVLWPLARRPTGAVLLGALSMISLFTLFGPVLDFNAVHYWVAAGYGLLVGGGGGVVLQRRIIEDRPPRQG